MCGYLCTNCVAGNITVEAVLAKYFQRSLYVNISYIYACFCVSVYMSVCVPVYELYTGNINVEAVLAKYFQRSFCAIISNIHKC